MLVDESRLRRPEDDIAEYFEGLPVNGDLFIDAPSGRVLITDPIYLADVYNDTDDLSNYVREHGTFIQDFGGDAGCPVWHEHPFAVLPLAMEDEREEPPAGATQIAEEVGCDSGSLVLMEMTGAIPPELREVIEEEIANGNAAVLELAPGRWEVWYEQFDAPQANMVGLYRNVVLKHVSG